MWAILAAGPVEIGRLAHITLTDQTTLSRTIAKLKQARLVQRPRRQDRRVKVVVADARPAASASRPRCRTGKRRSAARASSCRSNEVRTLARSVRRQRAPVRLTRAPVRSRSGRFAPRRPRFIARPLAPAPDFGISCMYMHSLWRWAPPERRQRRGGGSPRGDSPCDALWTVTLGQPAEVKDSRYPAEPPVDYLVGDTYPLTRIAVKSVNRIAIVQVASIVRLEAEDNYVRLWADRALPAQGDADRTRRRVSTRSSSCASTARTRSTCASCASCARCCTASTRSS